MPDAKYVLYGLNLSVSIDNDPSNTTMELLAALTAANDCIGASTPIAIPTTNALLAILFHSGFHLCRFNIVGFF